MDDYIEKKTALKIIDNYAKSVTADGKVVVDAIRDIVDVITPAADVVEVVRCKDCKYFTQDKIADEIMDICVYFGGMVSIASDGFCSYSERREKQ